MGGQRVNKVKRNAVEKIKARWGQGMAARCAGHGSVEDNTLIGTERTSRASGVGTKGGAGASKHRL